MDAGLAGSILLVPFLMGGRHPLGLLALVALAVATAVAWCARRCASGQPAWRPTWALALLLAGTALVALQLVPLPQAVLRQVSPQNAGLLPLWHCQDGSPAPWGPWRTVSLVPPATRDGLFTLVSYALLFLVAVHRIRAVGDVERVLRWCALAAGLMALLGLAQYVAGNGKFYWFYEHPFSDTHGAAKGAFSNRNHFAQFLALGIGPLVWWLQDAQRAKKTRKAAAGFARSDAPPSGLAASLLVLALGTVLFAGLLSLSRAGMVVMVAAGLIATAVCYRAASIRRTLLLGVLGAGLLIAGALAVFGAQRVARRAEDLTSGSVDRLDPVGGRRAIWTAAAKAFAGHWLLGAGVGSHGELSPAYMDVPLDHVATHAENCYLQVAVETGAAGLALVLGGMACCACWCLAGLRRGSPQRILVCAGAATASLAASALHAAVDYVWYVPGCMTPVILLAACALRSGQLAAECGAAAPSPARPWPWPARLAAAAALLPLGAWMTAGRVGPVIAEQDWHRYELARHAQDAAAPTDNGRALEPAAQAGLAAIEREQRWIGWLQRVVRWQPDHARAHADLAQAHLRLFDLVQSAGVNPMPLAQLREAALQSRFPSRDAMTAWLARAVGGHWQHLEQALRHAKRALALCPLEGKAYVYVGELAFLEGPCGPSQRACVDQAVRVRPLDGEVLYAAAMEALVAGDLTQYVEYLKRSYGCGPTHRQHLIRQLLAQAPEDGVEPMTRFLIETFSPGLEELRLLHGLASQRAKPEGLAALRRHVAAAAEAAAQTASGPEASRLWLEACGLRVLLGDGPRALQCARSACDCDPNRWDARCALGECLIRCQSFDEAERHLSWCLQRRPDDRALQKRYLEALRARLGQGGRTAAREGEDRR